jgi:hypothetical protein
MAPTCFALKGKDISTNNNMESINRKVNAKFLDHPGLIAWIGKCIIRKNINLSSPKTIFVLEFNRVFENVTASELKQLIEGQTIRKPFTKMQLDFKARMTRIAVLQNEQRTNSISIEFFLDSVSKFYLATGEHEEVVVSKYHFVPFLPSF